MKEQKPRLQIRRTVFNGQDGFLICGTDHMGRKPSVFTKTRESAERIKARLIAREWVTLEDFQEGAL